MAQDTDPSTPYPMPKRDEGAILLARLEAAMRLIEASLDQALKPFPCKHYEIHSRNPGNGTDEDDCQVCRTHARAHELFGD